MKRQTYPSDVSDDEWAFVAPYLTLMTEDAPQREHPLREVFNGLRWIVRTGAQWRMMPHDLPPWATVYQQTQRWLNHCMKRRKDTSSRAMVLGRLVKLRAVR
jgi:transposase